MLPVMFVKDRGNMVMSPHSQKDPSSSVLNTVKFIRPLSRDLR